jgi:hypothetical protein
VIAKLPGLPVHREHHFLRQVFGSTRFMPASSKKRNYLRREYTEKRIERILVGSFQKPFHDLVQIRHCLPSFARLPFAGALLIQTPKEWRLESITETDVFEVPLREKHGITQWCYLPITPAAGILASPSMHPNK